MANPILVTLPVDKTGTALSNLISNEIQTITSGNLLVLKYISFYSNSIVLTGVDNNNVEHTLIKNVDYECVDIHVDITHNVGNEVCRSIYLLNNLYNKYLVTYQAYGGSNYPNMENIISISNAAISKNIIEFKDIINKPVEYPPSEHIHDWKDVYGLEFLRDELLYIAKSIPNIPTEEKFALSSRINDLFVDYPVSNYFSTIDVSHLTSRLNPHNETSDNIGLGKVLNYPVISNYDTNKTYSLEYISPTVIKYLTNSTAVSLLNDIKIKQRADITTKATKLYNNIQDTATAANIELSNVTFNKDIIHNLNTIYTNINDKFTSALKYVKHYKHVEYNSELATVVKAIFLKAYSKNPSYGNLINVPVKIEQPYLWIDSSDSSTITSTLINNVSSIVSIKDKGSNTIYQQQSLTNNPTLVKNTYVGLNEVNLNNGINFSNNQYLSCTSPVILNNEYTVIALVKGTNSTINLLNSDNGDSYKLNNGVNNIVMSTGDVSFISSLTTPPNNKTLLSIASISYFHPNETWCLNNNSVNTDLGINSLKVGGGNFTLNSIGKNITNQNFTLYELLIYKRQLSIVEVNTINTYLSRKWSGTSDFNINTVFVTNYLG